ncbi:pseudouridine synthase [Rhodobacteraceae bacterium]|nr:pseudouridine synthase [Paracoccaceae bacterium]
MTTDSNSAPKSERIAKVIARAGVASRRDAEKLILSGKVAVNGKQVASPALDVVPSDKITIDGTAIDAPQETRVWLYYKPLGLVTTEKDEQGRRTIFDELPEGMPRVLNVGRLDINSEGLLLLTNDGGLKRRLELPETGWLRKYRVRVNGRPSKETFEPLRQGITIEGVDFQPMEVVLDRQQGANAWLTVGLREGKNREIRRAMAEVGMTVNRLIRLSYGPFRLNDMNPGDVTEIRRRILRDQLGPLLEEGGTAVDGDDDRGPRRDRDRRDGERGGRFEKRGDRPDRGNRPDRGERPDRGSRPDRGERSDRGERGERPNRGPRRDDGDKPRSFGRPREFGDRNDRGDRGDRFERNDRGGKSFGGGKPGGFKPRGDAPARAEGDDKPRKSRWGADKRQDAGQSRREDGASGPARRFDSRDDRGGKSFGGGKPGGFKPRGDSRFDKPARGRDGESGARGDQGGERRRDGEGYSGKPRSEGYRSNNAERSDRSGGKSFGGPRRFGDKPDGDRFKSDRSSGGKPSYGKPSGDRPSGDRPSYGKPSYGKPSGDRPSGDRPSYGKPSYGKPSGDRPSGDRPSYGKPSYGKPSGDRPSGDRPSYGKPSYGKPSGDKPSGGKPSYGKPSGGRGFDKGPSRGGPSRGGSDRGPGGFGGRGKGPGKPRD